MDSNAHSESWFCRYTDAQGDSLEEFIAGKNVYIHNEVGNPPTFSTINGNSNIDLTVTNNVAFPKISAWKVLEKITNSDHNCIYFEFQNCIYQSTPVNTVSRFCWNNRDLETLISKIQKILDFSFADTIEDMTPEDAIDYFNIKVTELCKSNQRRKKFFNRKPVPWWSQNLTELRKQVISAAKSCRRYKRLQLENAYVSARKHYRTIRNKYRKSINEAKHSSWVNFVAENNNKDPWGLAYKLMTNKYISKEVFHTVNHEGIDTTSWESSVEAILRVLVPDSDLNNNEQGLYSETCTQYLNRNEVDSSSTDGGITVLEIAKAIKKLKNKKAPGPDNITTEILKAIWMASPGCLHALYNRCFNAGKFPKDWKRAHVKIILKQADKDPALIKSYRPISLLSVAGKVYERIIVERLANICEDSNEHSTNQFGFTRGRSTEDAIHRMISYVQLNESKYTIGIFIDISGAFDNLPWASVLYRLTQLKCPPQLYRIFYDYFNDREVRIVNNSGDSICKYMSKGCPQGSIFGPLAWNLVLNRLLKEHAEEGLKDSKYIAYADDVLVLIHADSRNRLENIANREMARVGEWCRINNLEVSTQKTVALMLRGNFHKDRRPIISLNSNKIKFEDSNKYLGIWIDSRLSFVTHVTLQKQRIKTIFSTIKRVNKQTRGLGRNSLKLLYKCLFLPILLYGVGAWGFKAMHSHVKRQLEAAQRYVLLSMYRICKTTSTEAMQVLTGHLPIDLNAVLFAAYYEIRTNKHISCINVLPSAPGRSNEDITRLRGEETQHIYLAWQNRWENSTKGRITYKFIPEVDYVIKNKWFKPNVILTSILTGHGSVNYKLYNMKIRKTPLCPFCGQTETVEHVVWECRRYNSLRYDTIKEIEAGKHKDLHKLITNESEYNKFNNYIQMVYEERQWFKVEIQPASTRLGTVTHY